MKGLIFNLLSVLSSRAGCEDDAWEVALVGAALADEAEQMAAGDAEAALAALHDDAIAALDDPEDLPRLYPLQGSEAAEGPDSDELLALEDADLEAELFQMPYLDGEWGQTFRFLMRSAGPFSEDDWAHLPGTPVRFGEPRRPTQPPPGERPSFLPEGGAADPYLLLMLSLTKR